jgi:hypothetical protein
MQNRPNKAADISFTALHNHDNNQCFNVSANLVYQSSYDIVVKFDINNAKADKAETGHYLFSFDSENDKPFTITLNQTSVEKSFDLNRNTYTVKVTRISNTRQIETAAFKLTIL